MRSREQKLVDLCFSITMVVGDPTYNFTNMSMEEKAEWVRKQLESSGFKTEPCGSSWGMLV